MPITLQWDDDANTILRADYLAPWTWEEFFAAFEEGNRTLRASNREISIVNDLSRAGQPPPDLLGNIGGTVEALPPNLGLMIVASSVFYGKTVVQLLQHLYPDHMSNWRIAGTVDEARAMIGAWRSERIDREERGNAD